MYTANGLVTVSLAPEAFGVGRSISSNNLSNAPSSVKSQYNTVSRDKGTAGHPPSLRCY